MIVALIAAFLVLLGGGGSHEYMPINIEKPVKEHVEDKDCRKAIMDASDELSKELTTIQKEVEGLLEDYSDVLDNFTSAPSEFDDVAEQMTDQYEKICDKTVETRKKMRAQMTEEEWSAVFAPDQPE